MSDVTTDLRAVRCDGVTKVFGEGDTRTVVLRGVSAEIRMGEMTLIVGQSGCGKTTLISIIAGLLAATAGELAVLGRDFRQMSDAEQILFRRANLGFVFQAFNLLPALTAAENAAMPLFVAGWEWDQAVQAASDLLSKLGLGNRLHSLPKRLSGGQQQRVALARALVHAPRMVICDEPTSALDAKSGHTVMELLTETAVRPDRAVIVVTHDSRIFEFADSIITMEDGAVIGIESRAGRKRHSARSDVPELVANSRGADSQS